MVKLYHHSAQLAVLSSRSNGAQESQGNPGPPLGPVVQTNPISEGVSSLKFHVLSRAEGSTVQSRANFGQNGTSGERRIRETNCAKQTQFRRLGRPVEYPPFHYSIIPPFQADPSCKTKPISDSPAGPEGKMYETNPIWPGLESDRSSMGGRCKTNPIPRLRIGDRPAAARLPCRLPAVACAGQLYKRTQFRRSAGAPGAECAKRTQFRRSRAGRGLGDEGCLGKTKPICRWGDTPPFHYSIIPGFQSLWMDLDSVTVGRPPAAVGVRQNSCVRAVVLAA